MNNTLTITANEFNTVFIHMNGELIADSATFNRKRGFNNKMTGQWVYAPTFTPRKIKANPGIVIEQLALTGTLTVASVDVCI